MVGLIQRPVHQAVSPDKALPGSDSTPSFHFILYILAMFLIKYNFGKLVKNFLVLTKSYLLSRAGALY